MYADVPDMTGFRGVMCADVPDMTGFRGVMCADVPDMTGPFEAQFTNTPTPQRCHVRRRHSHGGTFLG